MPLLNFYGMYDHLVPPEACNMLTKAVGSADTEDITLDTGHIGIYVSSKCQREFAPKIIRWLRERDGEGRPVPVVAVADETTLGVQPSPVPQLKRPRPAAGKKPARSARPRPERPSTARPSRTRKEQIIKPSLTQVIQETI
jgi:polyhydroxyalkanoate synthase